MAAEQSADVRARLLTGALRRHKRLIATVGVVFVALGIAAAFALPKRFSATAIVLVTPLEGNPFSPEGRGDELINVQTEAQLVQTDPVARAVRGTLGSTEDLRELRSRVSVVVPPNTQVLEISFSARTADVARDGSQAFATSYLNYRNQRAKDVVQGRLRGLRDQIRKVEADLEKATKKRAAIGGGTAESSSLSQRISAYVDQLAVLNEQVSDAASTPIDPGQVITPAATPTQPSGPGMLIFGAAGLVGGLALGLVLAVARELRDDRIHDAQTLEDVGVAVLSEIPKTRDDEGLVVISARAEEAGEAYRRLRAAVVASIPQTPVVVLVTSVTRGRSAVLTSANLAVALSRTAVSTILVDAHSAGPSPSQLFRLSQSPGLSNVLLEGADPVSLLVQAAPSLRLMPAGTNPVEGAERYPGPQMREAITTLRQRADIAIVCAPSIQEADGQALCAIADAALLVVSLGTTTTEDLLHAIAEADRCGTTVLGAVANHGETTRRPRAPGSAGLDATPGPAVGRDNAAYPIAHPRGANLGAAPRDSSGSSREHRQPEHTVAAYPRHPTADGAAER